MKGRRREDALYFSLVKLIVAGQDGVAPRCQRSDAFPLAGG